MTTFPGCCCTAAAPAFAAWLVVELVSGVDAPAGEPGEGLSDSPARAFPVNARAAVATTGRTSNRTARWSHRLAPDVVDIVAVVAAMERKST
jgi:hypothetical protein